MNQATCPLCRRRCRPFWWNGKLIYEGHGVPLCEATGWLVEDDELDAKPPRKTRSDAGVARPDRRRR